MSVPSDERQRASRDIAERSHFFPTPPEGFNPQGRDAAVLWRYGIPPRPDEAAFPDLAAFWDDLFAVPLRFADPVVDVPKAQTRVTASLHLTPRARNQASLNWSGALITPRNGQQFTEVYGRWQVPSVSVPTGMPSTTKYRSSVWIGLDGSRQYFDSTLPQIGSAQEWDTSSGLPYYLWWQWWMRDNSLTYYPSVVPVTVAPTNEILAYLLVLDDTHVLFHIKNQSTGQSYRPLVVEAPRDQVTHQQAKVSGATAEWIVERPADPTTGLFDLPDYGAVTFTDCYAVQAILPSGAAPGVGTERTLAGSTLISMYRISGTPQRRKTISRPRSPLAAGVQVDYVGP